MLLLRLAVINYWKIVWNCGIGAEAGGPPVRVAVTRKHCQKSLQRMKNEYQPPGG